MEINITKKLINHHKVNVTDNLGYFNSKKWVTMVALSLTFSVVHTYDAKFVLSSFLILISDVG